MQKNLLVNVGITKTTLGLSLMCNDYITTGSTTQNCMANKEGVNGKLTPLAIWHAV